MKGIIFNLLENLVIDKFGDEIMEEIYEEAELLCRCSPLHRARNLP